MNSTNLFPLVTLSLLLTVLSADTAEGKGKKDKTPKDSEGPTTGKIEAKPGDAKKDPWIGVTITAGEKEVIQNFVKGFEEPTGKKGKKSKSLPPGLQKKLARGGSLPPGWEKKLTKSEVMPVEVYKECHPLPPEVVVKLPPLPKGVITVTIGGKVVRLLEATHEILDVFEVRW